MNRTQLVTAPLRTWSISLALLLAPANANGQNIPPGYEIVDITSNNGLHERAPRINNAGQVVFPARVPGSSTQSDIWMYDSATYALTQITNDDVYDTFPDIADDGTIVWMRNIGPDMGAGPTPEIMMRTPDGLITRITDNSDIDWRPRVNNHRQIVWHREVGVWACGGALQDIFLYDDGEIVAITNNAVRDVVENQAPHINDAGDIVWTEYDFCEPPFPYNFQSRIMLYRREQSEPLDSPSVTPQEVQLSDSGTVVWQGFDFGLRRNTIEVWKQGATTVLTNNGANAAINGLGDIAFNRWNGASEAWEVWLHKDGEFAPIAIDPFHNHSPSINDAGEITWAYGSLANGDIRLLRRFAPGDLNCDGAVDAFDIEPFVVVLIDPAGYGHAYPDCDPRLADINNDQILDAFDIEPFIAMFGGPP